MAFVDLDGDGNFDTAELVAGASKRLENMEKGNKALKKDVAVVMKRIAGASPRVAGDLGAALAPVRLIASAARPECAVNSLLTRSQRYFNTALPLPSTPQRRRRE